MYYKDESASTPVLVLERAVQDADMRVSLVSMFDDMNEDHSNALQTAIDNIPGS